MYILQADRQTWFSSPQSLSYLDGSLPGDFGFDPLGLSDPEGAGQFARIRMMRDYMVQSNTAKFNQPVLFGRSICRSQVVELRRAHEREVSHLALAAGILAVDILTGIVHNVAI